MNVSIISTYRSELDKRTARQTSRILLAQAEADLECPHSQALISKEGVEKVRNKLGLK